MKAEELTSEMVGRFIRVITEKEGIATGRLIGFNHEVESEQSWDGRIVNITSLMTIQLGWAVLTCSPSSRIEFI